jgi:hypothetical protein
MRQNSMKSDYAVVRYQPSHPSVQSIVIDGARFIPTEFYAPGIWKRQSATQSDVYHGVHFLRDNPNANAIGWTWDY